MNVTFKISLSELEEIDGMSNQYHLFMDAMEEGSSVESEPLPLEGEETDRLVIFNIPKTNLQYLDGSAVKKLLDASVRFGSISEKDAELLLHGYLSQPRECLANANA